jgi:acetyltransferase
MTNISDEPHYKPPKFLNELESKQMVKQAGIQVTETVLAKSRAEAISIAQEFGFPVVIKIFSPDMTHKSDVGGVVTG